MSKIIIVGGLVAFALFAAVPLHAQTGFDTPWSDFPVTNISKGDGEGAPVMVTFDSDLVLTVPRAEPSVAVQLEPDCTVALTVFFTEFPGRKGKAARGLDLGPVNRNCFGCQIVIVLEVISGDVSDITAQQVVLRQFLELIHKGANKKLGKQCFGPVGEPLPRFDVSKPDVPSDAFVQVSPTLWVFADTPRFCAFGLTASGFQIGDEATTPPEKGTLFPGDELFLEREFITYFTGECGTTTTTTTTTTTALVLQQVRQLMFYVRWCCAHKVTASTSIDGWVGKNVKCKPNPTPFPVIPPPLKPKDAKDFAAAQSALSSANGKDPYSLQLGEAGTVMPLLECPKK